MCTKGDDTRVDLTTNFYSLLIVMDFCILVYWAGDDISGKENTFDDKFIGVTRRTT